VKSATAYSAREGAFWQRHRARRPESEDGVEIRNDDHDSRVSKEVLALYASTIANLGPRLTPIECDINICLDQRSKVLRN
jgi:uncharacterized protein (UPF0276 family)